MSYLVRDVVKQLYSKPLRSDATPRFVYWVAGIALILILPGCSSDNDDAPPPVIPPATSLVEVGIYGSIVVEGADDLEFVISLAKPASDTVMLDYATSNTTAIAGSDYSATSGSLQFAPGEVRKFVVVPVINNSAVQTSTSKSMQLVLSNPQNAELEKSTATGVIVDRDAITADPAYDPGWSPQGAFTNAETCGASCHESQDPIMFYNAEDISPNTQWRHSVMANAFIDPYWQAAVEDEVLSFPQNAGLIEDTCTRCHAPMGHTHAYHTGMGLDADNFYRFDTANAQNHAREGVSCTVCHQIGIGNLGTAASFSGGFVIPDASSPDYKKVYGQYENPAGSNMFTQTGHAPVWGDYVATSELCATCHTLYTPSLDPDTGIPTGTSFLEQGPYFEWLNSEYATGEANEAQCQDCHMPEPFAGYSTKISIPPPNNLSDRSPYGQHILVGGNAHLLEILRDYRTELGIAASTTTTGFDAQISRTRDLLGSVATLAVSAPVVAANTLSFDIDITNHAGHKMPSSYPSRRMWLHVLVRNVAGDIIFESGKPDARGYISTDAARLKADCMSAHKLDGFDSSLCYEPHRDVINNPSQVAIYETVLVDVYGDITHTLLQAASYLKDNRIPPDGFTNSNAASIEIQTIPAGVTGDNDFNCIGTAEGCGADTVQYQVNIGGQAGAYTVEARLLYQATQPGFVDGMHNDGDRVNRFKLMYDAVPPSVELLATATNP